MAVPRNYSSILYYLLCSEVCSMVCTVLNTFQYPRQLRCYEEKRVNVVQRSFSPQSCWSGWIYSAILLLGMSHLEGSLRKENEQDPWGKGPSRFIIGSSVMSMSSAGIDFAFLDSSWSHDLSISSRSKQLCFASWHSSELGMTNRYQRSITSSVLSLLPLAVGYFLQLFPFLAHLVAQIKEY